MSLRSDLIGDFSSLNYLGDVPKPEDDTVQRQAKRAKLVANLETNRALLNQLLAEKHQLQNSRPSGSLQHHKRGTQRTTAKSKPGIRLQQPPPPQPTPQQPPLTLTNKTEDVQPNSTSKLIVKPPPSTQLKSSPDEIEDPGTTGGAAVFRKAALNNRKQLAAAPLPMDSIDDASPENNNMDVDLGIVGGTELLNDQGGQLLSKLFSPYARVDYNPAVPHNIRPPSSQLHNPTVEGSEDPICTASLPPPTSFTPLHNNSNDDCHQQQHKTAAAQATTTTMQQQCPDHIQALRLSLPQPLLLAAADASGKYLALLLGSHADDDPTELLLLRLHHDGTMYSSEEDSPLQQPLLGIIGAKTTTNKGLCHYPVPVDSFQVQRGSATSINRVQNAEFTPSCLLVTTDFRGEPIVVLSAAIEPVDTPSPGSASVHVLRCCTNNSAGMRRITTVECEEAVFALSISPEEPTTLIMASEDGYMNSVKFDSLWQSYVLGRSIAPSIAQHGYSHVHEISRLFFMPCSSSSSSNSISTNIVGVSRATGQMGMWTWCVGGKALPSTYTTDDQHQVLDLIPLPIKPYGAASDTTNRVSSSSPAPTGDGLISMYGFLALLRDNSSSDSTATKTTLGLALLEGDTEAGTSTLCIQPSSLISLTETSSISAVGIARGLGVIGTVDGQLNIWHLMEGKSLGVLNLSPGKAITSIVVMEETGLIVASSLSGDAVLIDLNRYIV